jgi:hypothetical protein
MPHTFKNNTLKVIYLANKAGRCVRLQPGASEAVHETMVQLCTYSPLTEVKEEAVVPEVQVATVTKTLKNTARK